MASTSSKALPFIGIAVGLIATFATLFGYGEEFDKGIAALQAVAPLILPSSTIVTFGGLINKALETRKAIIEATSVKEATDHILAEIEKAKAGK